MGKSGKYRIIKESIGMDEVVEVIDGRTPDGWSLIEMAWSGYTIKKVGDLPKAEKEKTK